MRLRVRSVVRDVSPTRKTGSRSWPSGPRRNKIGRLRRVAGSHRVVPLRVEAMAGDREGVDVFAGVFDAGGVLAGVKDTVDGQAGFGGEGSELDLPGADAVPVGPAAVGADEKPLGVRVAGFADGGPPGP